MADISLKLGFMGLGMGGSSIAHECAVIRMNVKNNMNPYTALVLNTNEVDLRKLPDRPNVIKHLLRGYERGAGRDMEVGEEAFVKHKASIHQQVEDFFTDRDFIFVVCGLGGGTGTGSVIEAVRLLYANGFAGRFGLILTLPRDQEGYRVLDNALNRLQMIAKAMKGLGCVLIVDNQKLFVDYLATYPQGSVTDFLTYSNRYIAQTLHDLNVVTARYNPTGAYHFDSSELLKMFQTPGILSFGKVTLDEAAVDAENQGTYLPAIKRSIEKGVLSEGYDLQQATRCAVSLLASPVGAQRIFTLGMVHAVEQHLVECAPYADERPVATYADESIRQLQAYNMFAGLPLPERVTELVDVVSRLEPPKVESEAVQALERYHGGRRTKEPEADLDTLLFGKPEVKAAPKQRPLDPKDPFAGL